MPGKWYNSTIITFFPKDLCDIIGKTGGYIIIHEYSEAYKLCKTYLSLYFYYSEITNNMYVDICVRITPTEKKNKTKYYYFQ